MRKSKTPPAPAPFVFLRDVLPELAKLLRADLLKIGQRELAEQIADLKIYGRCCDASRCGTFYCLPPNERTTLRRTGRQRAIGDMVTLNGRIAQVDTCLSEVDSVLRNVFPEPESLTRHSDS